MSITDELRKAADDIASTAVPCGASPDYIGVRRKIGAIADRIDAEHEKAVTAAHSNGITEYGSMVAREYVKLPVDADGECIHIGDVMETDNGIREVDVLQKSSRKWSVGLVPVGGGAFSWHDAETLRHHHAPTVEDVLTKMLEQAVGYSDAHTTVALNTIAEYAAKLRLAGEDE